MKELLRETETLLSVSLAFSVHDHEGRQFITCDGQSRWLDLPEGVVAQAKIFRDQNQGALISDGTFLVLLSLPAGRI